MEPIQTEVVVIGGGPGGYAAAFYAADLGKKVVLVEKDPQLGGVCLNRGCIPSKALLHATELIGEAKVSAFRGISFGEPKIELSKLRAWKSGILKKLAQGIGFLAHKRGVEVIYGRGHFEDSNTVRIETQEGQKFVKFDKAVVAVGSVAMMPKAFDLGNPRVMTSREALELEDVPEELLVIGGGYIGMELGTVYAGLGSNVTVIEALDSILAGGDPDLVRPVNQYAKSHFKNVFLKTKVASMATEGKKIKVVSEGPDGTKSTALFDRVLVSVGRRPNCENMGLENTQVQVDENGFIKVNGRQETDDSNIFAIGDCVGGYMLAHKAHKEARVAVEVLCGEETQIGNSVIPAVVFTDPEVAWCGLTEAEAKSKGIAVEVSKFPWAASGRAMSFDRVDGLTKLIIDPESERILGVGLVGRGAGEMIAEGTLAIEMGATAFDVAKTVHPHPTLSETLMEAAENFYGHATHTIGRKRK